MVKKASCKPYNDLAIAIIRQACYDFKKYRHAGLIREDGTVVEDIKEWAKKCGSRLAYRRLQEMHRSAVDLMYFLQEDLCAGMLADLGIQIKSGSALVKQLDAVRDREERAEYYTRQLNTLRQAQDGESGNFKDVAEGMGLYGN